MEKAPRRRLAFYATITPLLMLLGLSVFVAHALDDTDQSRAMAATVQVIAVISEPDYDAPWQCRPIQTVTGSGVLLEDGRVLTNAHVVANAASIELRRMGLTERYLAHVEHIDHGSDLAVLTVEKPEFAAGVEALPLGGMPEMEATVNVYGYPLNAQTVCSTEGVVSRLEYEMYAHGFNYLLMAQLDASINPGNSGGPAIVDGQIVGLAMQKPDDAEGSGQFIPAPVIRRFLDDVADGRVDGLPDLGIHVQLLESEALRASCGMSASRTGVLVRDIASTGSCAGVLQVDDVLLSIDGQPVANDATVALDTKRRVDLNWPAHGRQVSERVTLEIWRAGAVVTAEVTLVAGGSRLAAPRFPAQAPYRIFGGLVFQPVDMNLAIANNDELPTNILTIYNRGELQTDQCRERVTLGRVLPHGVNRGYQDWGTELIETVQGVPVRDFAHFNELLDAATGRWITIVLDDNTKVVLDLPASRAALPEILKTFKIAGERQPAAEPGTVVAGVTP